jgi:predicted lipoprotein with Yx(FWY)xxD motif
MKTTKTIIIVAIILFLALIASGAGAFATYAWKANDSFVKITNMLIDADGVTNYKFTDKVGTSTVTCYGSYSKRTTSIGNIVDSNAISCIK